MTLRKAAHVAMSSAAWQEVRVRSRWSRLASRASSSDSRKGGSWYMLRKGFYFRAPTDHQRRSLVYGFRDDVQDRLLTISGDSASLFRDQSKWIRFVKQAQLATGVTLRWRVQKYTALQERSV